MAEGTNLTEERDELKRQLVAREHRSSVDVILQSVGWVLQKLTRRTKLPPPWISALAVALLISSIAYVSSLLTGGVSRDGYRTIVLGGVLIFSDLIVAKSAFDRAYATLQAKLLDGLASNHGLPGLDRWVAATGSIGRPALVGVFIYVVSILNLRDPAGNPAYTVVMGGVMFLWTGFMLYYMALFVALPLRLGRCQFKLHVEDPVSTELLVDWSDMMNFVAYMFALMLATGTLFTVAVTTFTMRTLAFVILRWLPLIALFVVNQVAIYGVIFRSKRETLNEVQALMAALRPTTDPPDNPTMETLLWLWDYHDRIKSTRNSILDVKGIANLVNTLLIPLAAFLIANREAIVALLGWFK